MCLSVVHTDMYIGGGGEYDVPVCIPNKVWEEITYPFSNCNSSTVD